MNNIHIIGAIMINIIINLKANSIISLWSDGSITWLPLDQYEFKEDIEYSVVEQDGTAGFSHPRIVKGDFLIVLLKKIKKYIDK